MALFDQNDAGGISASSRWLRSVSDDTTGRIRDIRSCTPAGVPAAFFRPHDRWCRFAQPPATRFDASGIILLRDISFLTATSITRINIHVILFDFLLFFIIHWTISIAYISIQPDLQV
jgi:hypothetical protein